MLSHVQVPLSLGFCRQEYQNGQPFPLPGDLPSPGIEPVSPALAGCFFTIELPGKPIGKDTYTQCNDLLQKEPGRGPASQPNPILGTSE